MLSENCYIPVSGEILQKMEIVRGQISGVEYQPEAGDTIEMLGKDEECVSVMFSAAN
jgi:hypothetical protein